MNKDALVIIFLGFPALNKKSIGLKKIPPPIPTIPEMNPKTPPIRVDTANGIFYNFLPYHYMI